MIAEAAGVAAIAAGISAVSAPVSAIAAAASAISRASAAMVARAPWRRLDGINHGPMAGVSARPYLC